MRTFDADALMLHMDASKYIRNNSAYTHGWNDALEHYINYIAEQATVDAEPVKSVRWVTKEIPEGIIGLECSNCGFECGAGGLLFYNYCPNCGAKMDKGDE